MSAGPRADEPSAGRPPGIDTLLFDLDGTLVDQFQPFSSLQFTWLVVRRFAGLAPPRAIVRAGHAAVAALQAHGTDRPNFEVRVETFAREAGGAPAEAARRVVRLADEDFRAMGWRFRPVPGARATIERAKALGFRVVLATNPTVPLPMTRHRLAWAGLADVEWDLLTHPEACTRTKPDPAYYAELLGKLGTTADRCLMIGNDPRKDLPAMALGIRTFILDRPMSRKDRAALRRTPPDDFGSFADLDRLIDRLAREV